MIWQWMKVQIYSEIIKIRRCNQDKLELVINMLSIHYSLILKLNKLKWIDLLGQMEPSSKRKNTANVITMTNWKTPIPNN